MRDRRLLALSKLGEFAAWAKTKGYRREKTKGHYEVLRLRKPGEKPRLYFRRDVGGGVHATCQAASVGLVKRWLREREA
jgi:hypothetical protein